MNKITMGLLAVLAIGAVSCKKNIDQQANAGRGLNADPVYTDTITLSGEITSNTTLLRHTLYFLDGKVFVAKGATLTIEAGTHIRGIKYTNPVDASALIVIRGAKINAVGTADAPILFTSAETTTKAPGDWGGVVLLGKAPINKPDTLIEGINSSIPLPSDLSLDSLRYGGSSASDNSGIIKYTKIEYAGASIAANNELNGLTLGGVGNGTTLSYIESYYGRDDAFEFFGGTVNADHLVAFANDDDSYDTDFGFNGSISYALSILDPNKPSYSSDPNGLECDNDGQGSAATPQSHPTFDHLTIIGFQDSTAAAGKGLLYGARFRRNTNYTLTNSVFLGYPYGTTLESSTTQSYYANFHNNLVSYFKTDVDPASGISAATITALLASNYFVKGAATDANAFTGLDDVWGGFYTPIASPATDGGVGGTYLGAFDLSGSQWTDGWTNLTYIY